MLRDPHIDRYCSLSRMYAMNLPFKILPSHIVDICRKAIECGCAFNFFFCFCFYARFTFSPCLHCDRHLDSVYFYFSAYRCLRVYTVTFLSHITHEIIPEWYVVVSYKFIVLRIEHLPYNSVDNFRFYVWSQLSSTASMTICYTFAFWHAIRFAMLVIALSFFYRLFCQLYRT